MDVIRQVLRREAPVALDGRFHSHPYRGADGTGIGKPLKPITHPLRADLPVLLGAEGPKNIAQTTRIADGWLPSTGRRPARTSTRPRCPSSPRGS